MILPPPHLLSFLAPGATSQCKCLPFLAAFAFVCSKKEERYCSVCQFTLCVTAAAAAACRGEASFEALTHLTKPVLCCLFSSPSPPFHSPFHHHQSSSPSLPPYHVRQVLLCPRPLARFLLLLYPLLFVALPSLPPNRASNPMPCYIHPPRLPACLLIVMVVVLACPRTWLEDSLDSFTHHTHIHDLTLFPPLIVCLLYCLLVASLTPTIFSLLLLFVHRMSREERRETTDRIKANFTLLLLVVDVVSVGREAPTHAFGLFRSCFYHKFESLSLSPLPAVRPPHLTCSPSQQN